jgi:hypothetical protein
LKQFVKYEWKEDLLWYEERIFVPESKALRLELLEQYRDSPIAGHQGQTCTLELLSRDYYWPGMKSQVNRYVESCENCQRCHDSAWTLGFISLKSGGTITNLTAKEYGRGQQRPGL